MRSCSGACRRACPSERGGALVPAVEVGLDRGGQVGHGEVKVPRRMACRVMIEKKHSTRFNQLQLVGVKWMCTRGFLASQALTVACLWVEKLSQTTCSCTRG